MTKATLHTTIVTNEPDRVASVVRDVLGFQENGTYTGERALVNDLFGWSGEGAIQTTFFGREVESQIEIAQIADAVEGPVVSSAPSTGILHICVEMADVAAALEVARTHDVDFIGGPIQFDGFIAGIVRVAGIQFELSQDT